ncbi:MAG: glycoside hydrolase family 3 C-terminal domain-containing protein [Holophagaceae bacterium]|nr:glycoside hydrolase family 3 C-terminal domain-containing protein [Holophagaceae bacterium]
MKKYLIFALVAILGWGGDEKLPYQNPLLSATARTVDLISRMTLEEKVGQLLCQMGWEMYEKSDDGIKQSSKFEVLVNEQHIGMLWATFRADPWTKKTIANGLNPAMAAMAGNALQKYAIENSRLGIPIFLAEESPHGHMAIGATVFPTAIGQASTWNPLLIEQMATAIAKEVRAQGAHIGYGPILDLARDPRWSRVEETYGEDHVLIAQMGRAFVKGSGGGVFTSGWGMLSTLKHFAGYGVPEGGHNGSQSLLGERELLENFLPPFRVAIDAGALSVMTAYNSIDGIPCTSNRNLLTDILRKDWGFRGFVVSDLGSIEGLRSQHFVAQTNTDAAMLSLSAGVDVDLGGRAFINLVDAVRKGKIDETLIDAAVSRVLYYKFAMGLFERPYVEPSTAVNYVRSDYHVMLARRLAQESIVLLKNTNNILPLRKDVNKIAVVGPNAHNVYNMLGDYTAPQDDGTVSTVLEGIKKKVGTANVEYVKGCAIRDMTSDEISSAVDAALRADVVIAVVGGSSARDFRTEYIETGAAVASQKGVSDMESGEGFDRMSLNLLGKQETLIKALLDTGKPLVVIYIQGRPLNMNLASECADALLTAWYPGQEGGNAIADVLFGDYNPAGRLPISVPRHEGQIPVYYNKRNPKAHDYVEMSSTALFPFGYGRSYTTFEYSRLKVIETGKHTYRISFNIKNTGPCDGDEVAQLYISNRYVSVVQPMQQLRHFSRVHLKKGEEREIVFFIEPNDLSFIDQHMKLTVEDSIFTVMVGASSEDIRMREQISKLE